MKLIATTLASVVIGSVVWVLVALGSLGLWAACLPMDVTRAPWLCGQLVPLGAAAWVVLIALSAFPARYLIKLARGD